VLCRVGARIRDPCALQFIMIFAQTAVCKRPVVPSERAWVPPGFSLLFMRRLTLLLFLSSEDSQFPGSRGLTVLGAFLS
jgi:hypothetical protein